MALPGLFAGLQFFPDDRKRKVRVSHQRRRSAQAQFLATGQLGEPQRGEKADAGEHAAQVARAARSSPLGVAAGRGHDDARAPQRVERVADCEQAVASIRLTGSRSITNSAGRGPLPRQQRAPRA